MSLTIPDRLQFGARGCDRCGHATSSARDYRNEMAKTGRAPQLRVVTPEGPVTALPVPLAVEFRLNWDPPFQSPTGDLLQDGWAMAFTREAGLVIWLLGDKVAQAWLPADHIRRR